MESQIEHIFKIFECIGQTIQIKQRRKSGVCTNSTYFLTNDLFLLSQIWVTIYYSTIVEEINWLDNKKNECFNNYLSPLGKVANYK